MNTGLIICIIYYLIGFIWTTRKVVIDLKKNGLLVKEIFGVLAMWIILPVVWPILFLATVIVDWWEKVEDKRLF